MIAFTLSDPALLAVVNGGIDPIVELWQTRMINVGGGFESDSLNIASGLVAALKSAPYYSKIKWLVPLLGTGIASATVPLIDTLNVGPAQNNGYTNGQFSQSAGVSGDYTDKWFDTLIKIPQLGASNQWGAGYWENNITGYYSTWLGFYLPGHSLFGLYGYSVGPRFFSGQSVGEQAVDGSPWINAHYYGQRNSVTDRRIYRNGVQVGASTVTALEPAINVLNLYWMGFRSGEYAGGRCAAAYLTDGTLTDVEITAFHALLTTYLIIPTGRP